MARIYDTCEQQFISYAEFNVCFISEALNKYPKEASLTAILKFDSGWRLQFSFFHMADHTPKHE